MALIIYINDSTFQCWEAKQGCASAKRPLVHNHLPSKSTNAAFSDQSPQEIEAEDYMFPDNLKHPRPSLCLLSFHGGITLQSDRRLFKLREGSAKSKKCHGRRLLQEI